MREEEERRTAPAGYGAGSSGRGPGERGLAAAVRSSGRANTRGGQADGQAWSSSYGGADARGRRVVGVVLLSLRINCVP